MRLPGGKWHRRIHRLCRCRAVAEREYCSNRPAVDAQRMKLVDTRFSGTGSPYFSRPRAMLRMRKTMFSASARIIWSPSKSSAASPGFSAVDAVPVLSGGNRHAGNGKVFIQFIKSGRQATKLSFLEPTANSVLILAAPREKTNQNGEPLPIGSNSPFLFAILQPLCEVVRENTVW